MDLSLRPYPAVRRLAPACAAGIAAGVFLAGKPWPVLLCAGVLITATLFVAFRHPAGTDRQRAGIDRRRLWWLLPVFLLLFGFFRHEWNLARMNGLFAQWSEQSVEIVGHLSGEPEVTTYGIIFTVSVESLDSDGRTASPNGQVRATLYGTALSGLPRYGDRIRISGTLRLPEGRRNPGGFDMAMYLVARGIQAQMTLDGSPEPLPENRGNFLMKWGFAMKQGALAQLDRYLPSDAAPVMAGILLGETSELDPDLQDAFRAAGLSHVMAVSGANIAFILLPLMWLFRRLGVNRRWSSVAALPLLFLFVLMTGFGASIVRAAVMATLMLAGGILWRKTDMASSLSCTFALMLAVNSAWLFDVGFQLSVLATAAIGLFCEPLSMRLPERMPKTLRDTLAATLSAQAGVMPVLTGTFHTLSLLSIPANLLVVPITGFLTLMGALLVLSGLILPLAGAGIGYVLGFVITLLIRFVTWTAALPGAQIAVASPPFLAVALYAAWLLWLRFGRQFMPLDMRRRVVPVAGIASILLLSATMLPDHRLQVIVADVGQGDGILIRTPAGKSIVIDGGGSAMDSEGSRAGERVMLPMLRTEGIVRPDLMISTHPHADHLLGLQAVAERGGARGIILSYAEPAGGASAGLLEIAERKGIPVRHVSAGDVIWSEPELTLSVLSPEKGWSPGKPDPNETSLVLRLEYRDFSMLLMADTEEASELRLAEQGLLEPADVMKVGHHGARYGTTSDFLASVQPKLAVISVGRNSYGHPAPETLERLQAADVAVHSTRSGGALLLETNGQTIFWEAFIKPVHTVFDSLYP